MFGNLSATSSKPAAAEEKKGDSESAPKTPGLFSASATTTESAAGEKKAPAGLALNLGGISASAKPDAFGGASALFGAKTTVD